MFLYLVAQTVTVQTWMIPIIVTLFLAVLGAGWKVSTQALEAVKGMKEALTRLEKLELRLNTISVLEEQMKTAKEDIMKLRGWKHDEVTEKLHELELRIQKVEMFCENEKQKKQ